MKFLLAAGLGPYIMSFKSLDGTLLAPDGGRDLAPVFTRLVGEPVDLGALTFGDDGRRLLRRSRDTVPHLVTESVRSIVEAAGVECEVFNLEDRWEGKSEPTASDVDVIGISTTFICDALTLKHTIKWLAKLYPGVPMVLGGQYSNLKYAEILQNHDQVTCIIRGDAEEALPKLLRVLGGEGELQDVPNLVWRDRDGRLQTTRVGYVNLDETPAPAFHGRHDIVPYESMRGCPYVCKYCSYPAASPEWRARSAERICHDWATYAEANGASLVRAMDSTFTVPRDRFRKLLKLLPEVGINWEAYTRANTIDTPEVVDELEAAGCQWLLIGFESMSDRTLKFMDKRVSAAQNLRAMELLAGSRISLRTSFMVGFPGEAPEDYRQTHDFIVERLSGRFGIHVFVFVDETMPVWDDAALHELELTNPVVWKHKGMDSATATALREDTLRQARWKNEDAVLSIWQQRYERPIVAGFDDRQNRRVEKLIERLSFSIKDWGEGPEAASRAWKAIHELERMGVRGLPGVPAAEGAAAPA